MQVSDIFSPSCLPTETSAFHAHFVEEHMKSPIRLILSLHVSDIMIICAVTTGVCRHSYVSHVKSRKCYLNKVAILRKNIFCRDCDFNSVIQQFHEIASFPWVCLPAALKYDVTVDTTPPTK